MLSVNEIKQFLVDEQLKLWGIAVAIGFMNGFLPIVSVLFIVFYVYIDSKNVAFDSTKLSDSHDIIKIGPLERG